MGNLTVILRSFITVHVKPIFRKVKELSKDVKASFFSKIKSSKYVNDSAGTQVYIMFKTQSH